MSQKHVTEVVKELADLNIDRYQDLPALPITPTHPSTSEGIGTGKKSSIKQGVDPSKANQSTDPKYKPESSGGTKQGTKITCWLCSPLSPTRS